MHTVGRMGSLSNKTLHCFYLNVEAIGSYRQFKKSKFCVMNWTGKTSLYVHFILRMYK
jgi:hypothetical protein